MTHPSSGRVARGCNSLFNESIPDPTGRTSPLPARSGCTTFPTAMFNSRLRHRSNLPARCDMVWHSRPTRRIKTERAGRRPTLSHAVVPVVRRATQSCRSVTSAGYVSRSCRPATLRQLLRVRPEAALLPRSRGKRSHRLPRQRQSSLQPGIPSRESSLKVDLQ